MAEAYGPTSCILVLHLKVNFRAAQKSITVLCQNSAIMLETPLSQKNILCNWCTQRKSELKSSFTLMTINGYTNHHESLRCGVWLRRSILLRIIRIIRINLHSDMDCKAVRSDLTATDIVRLTTSENMFSRWQSRLYPLVSWQSTMPVQSLATHVFLAKRCFSERSEVLFCFCLKVI